MEKRERQDWTVSPPVEAEACDKPNRQAYLARVQSLRDRLAPLFVELRALDAERKQLVQEKRGKSSLMGEQLIPRVKAARQSLVDANKEATRLSEAMERFKKEQEEQLSRIERRKKDIGFGNALMNDKAIRNIDEEISTKTMSLRDERALLSQITRLKEKKKELILLEQERVILLSRENPIPELKRQKDTVLRESRPVREERDRIDSAIKALKEELDSISSKIKDLDHRKTALKEVITEVNDQISKEESEFNSEMENFLAYQTWQTYLTWHANRLAKEEKARRIAEEKARKEALRQERLQAEAEEKARLDAIEAAKDPYEEQKEQISALERYLLQLESKYAFRGSKKMFLLTHEPAVVQLFNVFRLDAPLKLDDIPSLFARLEEKRRLYNTLPSPKKLQEIRELNDELVRNVIHRIKRRQVTNQLYEEERRRLLKELASMEEESRRQAVAAREFVVKAAESERIRRLEEQQALLDAEEALRRSRRTSVLVSLDQEKQERIQRDKFAVVLEQLVRRHRRQQAILLAETERQRRISCVPEKVLVETTSPEGIASLSREIEELADALDSCLDKLHSDVAPSASRSEL